MARNILASMVVCLLTAKSAVSGQATSQRLVTDAGAPLWYGLWNGMQN